MNEYFQVRTKYQTIWGQDISNGIDIKKNKTKYAVLKSLTIIWITGYCKEKPAKTSTEFPI